MKLYTQSVLTFELEGHYSDSSIAEIRDAFRNLGITGLVANIVGSPKTKDTAAETRYGKVPYLFHTYVSTAYCGGANLLPTPGNSEEAPIWGRVYAFSSHFWRKTSFSNALLGVVVGDSMAGN